MFVIYYKSKYSSDMFYNLKFSEMVHSGSDMMAGMLSVFCVCFACPKRLFWNPECLWFITSLNIAQICFMIEISQKWYILDLSWWLLYFLCSVYVLLAQRACTYVFSISKSFCKSCISPEYSNCDNSHFSLLNLVLQLLRAPRWCRNIFPTFSKKFRPNQRCGRWWMRKSHSGWPFALWGFWSTTINKGSFLPENHESMLRRGVIQNSDGIKLIFCQLQLVCVI
jgi:hypothetical protein